MYKAYTEAMIFDAESAYDLASITNSAREFDAVFLRLSASDSLKDIKEAEILLPLSELRQADRFP